MKWLVSLLLCIVSTITAAQSTQPHTSPLTTVAAEPTYQLITISKAYAQVFKQANAPVIVRQLSDSSFITTALPMLPATIGSASRPADDQWKFSPALATNRHLRLHDREQHQFLVQTSAPGYLERHLVAGTGIAIVQTRGNIYLLSTTFHFLQQHIIPLAGVQFADYRTSAVQEEQSVPGFNDAVNTVNKLHSVYPSLNGQGLVVALKEQMFDTADIDFTGRVIPSATSSKILSTHASVMASLIAGAGNTSPAGKGVAPAAGLISTSFDELLPDSNSWYTRYKVSVQNHSYGTGIEYFYGADAAAYDASVVNNKALLHVFSAGNAGNQSPASGRYSGISGFANITGSFKMAKNIITVGATDADQKVAALSSRNPAYDGRIQPQIVAFGQDGSSGAAALVSGTAVLLQQAYALRHNGMLPDAALVRAILLNSARKEAQGPDFSAGYGSLDAHRAIKVMTQEQYFSGEVSNGQTASFFVEKPANTTGLKLMLAWDDPPAPANAFTALINDLDLTVMDNASGKQWLPWVLNSSPAKDSLLLMPIRARDTLNNQEQVSIDDSSALSLQVTVTSTGIQAGTQRFYLVYQWDTLNAVQWTFPTSTDNLLPGERQQLRWQSNSSAAADISYKYIGQQNWQPLAVVGRADSGQYSWPVPDTAGVAILRMMVNGRVYSSDSFTISAPLQTGVGYNCEDSALMYWKGRSAGGYQLLRLGSRYMEPLAQTADTFFFINKHTSAARWYSVAPLLPGNRMGIQSTAFDYSQQGVDCYLSSFTADLSGAQAELSLQLGTAFQVARLLIEKADGAGIFHDWQTLSAPFTQRYNLQDKQLAKGNNLYRIRIELAGNKSVYSNIENVFWLAGDSYIIYPNPVTRPAPLHVVSAALNNQQIDLFNAMGQKMFSKRLIGLAEILPTAGLSRGSYFYIIYTNGHKEKTGTVLIQ